MEIVKTCKGERIPNVFVSSITYRPQYQSKINKINELLQDNAGIFKYQFIDNTSICKEHLKKDGVHLNKEGICILANNFLAHLNRTSVLPFYDIWED